MGEIRGLRREMNDLSLEFRAEGWGYKLRDNISRVRESLAGVSRIAKMMLVVGLLMVSWALFVKDHKLKQQLLTAAANLIITALIIAG
jgi:hypothetical protein